MTPPTSTSIAGAGHPTAEPAPVASAEVLGVPLALIDYAGTLEWIDAAVAERRRAYICVAAVHTVMACD
ncbi:MAG TPA: glycosyltransferase, partial [Solirubrobacteraceae bacterium]|nr:glycosyltransferase [Solirubrobacteraceae bacterium]